MAAKTQANNQATPPAKKMGRPRIQIDQNIFEGLCKIKCTQLEICSVLGCSEDTINRWAKRTYNGKTFAEIHEYFSANAKASIRRKQYEVAMQGNVQMLKWLGTNWLGQSDKPEEYTDIV